jgi:hypothetical protein
MTTTRERENRNREKNDAKAVHGVWNGLTIRLTDAGAMMSDCQLRRDPGVRCSRWLDHVRHYQLRSPAGKANSLVVGAS